jgi:3-keto-5-aminohexanoate cleavage enzyme
MRKVLLSVAPVCHETVSVPKGVKVPYTPEEVASEVIECAGMGTGMVHLHVRNEEGKQTADLKHFSKTIDLIRKESDIIIQGSTGGVAELSLDERCVSLNDARVEVASLNMGSANLGEGVYINTLPDIRYWAKRMMDANVIPEMEIFDLSMIDSVVKIGQEGLAKAPFSFSFCMGFENAIQADPDHLSVLKRAIPAGSHWGIIHENMTDLSILAAAAGMGASLLRFGFEDSFIYGEGKLARTNMDILDRLLTLLELMDMEPMTAAEARTLFGIKTDR